MNGDTILKVEGVYKKFSRSLRRSMLYGSTDIAKSMLGLNYDSSKLRKGEFWSLQNINFELKRGETIGLVGANGSGKSTLLRLINGIFPPDVGKISVKGRIGALIAVGAGFHPHMTGRENIYLNGVILGMTKKEIDSKFQDIIDFAEIGDFIDAPVSTYSSGMYVRLGFAIAIHSLPDIVLIDEVLAVGDAKFQRKCLDKIKELREKTNTSFVIVSHNMQNIESMCTKVVLLNKGSQVMVDTPQNIIPVYELMLQTGQPPENFIENNLKKHNQGLPNLDLIFSYPDFGTDEITIEKVSILNQKLEIVKQIFSEDPFSIKIDIDSKITNRNSIIYISVTLVNDRDDDNKNFISMGFQKSVDVVKGKSEVSFLFEKALLTTGEYKIGVFIFDSTHTNPFAQGYYGYFYSKATKPTMLRAGGGTPLLWVEPIMSIPKND